MKRTKNSVGLLSRYSASVIPLLLIALVLPVLTLTVLGLISVYQNGYWLELSLLVVASSLLVMGGFFWLRRSTTGPQITDDALKGEYSVAPSGEWGAFDRAIWDELDQQIAELLAQDASWVGLREHSLTLAMQVANRYYPERKGHELAFTAPEFLLMLEQVSHRYRHFLLNHVPFAEHLKLSMLQRGYQYKDKLGTAKKAYDIYRIFRALTPAGLIAEARGQLIGHLFDEVSDEVQRKLKTVLLQEVISVAIDLYRGHFTVTDGELEESAGSKRDSQQIATELEPLRVAVLGQVSAGKSSFINAFIGSMVAEVSAIPSTDNIIIHRCDVEGIDIIHLVDLPGIDGSKQIDQLLLEQVTQSDVVFWVVKANQPARQLDVALRQQVDDFYQQAVNRSRKKPRIIMLLNQIDRLQPISEWYPPYDLTHPKGQKGETIKAALEYNVTQLEPDDAIVFAMPDQQPVYNLPAVGESLLAAFEDGVNTQLNRRRIEHSSVALSQQAKRLYRLGKVAASKWLE
ncbi:GTPase family protein [Photobacterium nomapromontoriensis]|uniref:GTPase family protein n=1 Tax=Photobacterium nomapromontoriensis TaxID=2910237 RepID=UPI003D0D7B2D